MGKTHLISLARSDALLRACCLMTADSERPIRARRRRVVLIPCNEILKRTAQDVVASRHGFGKTKIDAISIESKPFVALKLRRRHVISSCAPSSKRHTTCRCSFIARLIEPRSYRRLIRCALANNMESNKMEGGKQTVTMEILLMQKLEHHPKKGKMNCTVNALIILCCDLY